MIVKSYPDLLCNLCKKAEKLSERQLLHAVKRGFELVDADGAGDAEVARGAHAERRAGTNENMGLIEQDLAEGFFVQSRFLYAGEKVERALRPHQTQVGDLFDAVGGVEDAVVNFMTQKMTVQFEDGREPKSVMKDVLKACKKIEPDCEIEF